MNEGKETAGLVSIDTRWQSWCSALTILPRSVAHIARFQLGSEMSLTRLVCLIRLGKRTMIV